MRKKRERKRRRFIGVMKQQRMMKQNKRVQMKLKNQRMTPIMIMKK